MPTTLVSKETRDAAFAALRGTTDASEVPRDDALLADIDLTDGVTFLDFFTTLEGLLGIPLTATPNDIYEKARQQLTWGDLLKVVQDDVVDPF